MSLPYFNHFGWVAEVAAVEPRYTDMVKDELLLKSLPADVKVHWVSAWSKRWTSKLGLGSIALRSLWFYYKGVNRILRNGHFDLVYFSTTQFPVCILGACWKRRFDIPYVIDLQDPWHSGYYRDKPRSQRPPKYWFSYRLNKFLEPIAMRKTDGLIGVSADYLQDIRARYPQTRRIPSRTITFGSFAPDLHIAQQNKALFPPLLENGMVNIVYVGRGGEDMHTATVPLFQALRTALTADPERYGKVRLHFIGTSYAPEGKGRQTIFPLAQRFGLEDYVTEIPGRVSFYHALLTLQEADALFIPGSDDAKYTASKIYPYVLAGRPLLAIFHPDSSAIPILREYGVKDVLSFDEVRTERVGAFLAEVCGGTASAPRYQAAVIKKYAAENMTHEQCLLFDQVLAERRDR
ncbi:glycosyltransferase family 4 protein [Mucilaginibacter ginsenosidivorans]|uniref:Glycosyltransferase family 4 protein n=2 Tax=Mucilaginibacter ginsenosidivorans TaxID=398053 RepID=A0A5B8V293_9SPHI|nr:glycosyltransferase family 4 protein [Mucilaginibacter ginsenosidivorans]